MVKNGIYILHIYVSERFRTPQRHMPHFGGFGMREHQIESYLVDLAQRKGGLCYKWQSTRRGVPDRLLFIPGGKVVLVEVKAPGEKPTTQQLYVHGLLREKGQDVRVVDSRESVERLIEELM